MNIDRNLYLDCSHEANKIVNIICEYIKERNK